MDCAAISAEVQANNKKIAELGSEEGGKVAQNIAAGVIGIVIWPVWFGMASRGGWQGSRCPPISPTVPRHNRGTTLRSSATCADPDHPAARGRRESIYPR